MAAGHQFIAQTRLFSLCPLMPSNPSSCSLRAKQYIQTSDSKASLAKKSTADDSEEEDEEDIADIPVVAQAKPKPTNRRVSVSAGKSRSCLTLLLLVSSSRLDQCLFDSILKRMCCLRIERPRPCTVLAPFPLPLPSALAQRPSLLPNTSHLAPIPPFLTLLI